MDYFATSKLDPEQTGEVVTGIVEACKAAGMVLLGGETAEMPGVYQPHGFDVAGTIVGVLEREAILPRSTIQPGDVLIGFQSSGPHTNGFSLIRKVFENTYLDDSLADSLLAPHRSYFNVLYPHLASVKALAHITGGGFFENLPRVLPENLSAVIHLNSWQVPPIWTLIQEKGNISTDEMYRVFNMGIGMVAVVDKSIVDDFQSSISELSFAIGELVKGERKVILN
jgi:phosphoribosylformylglycinamidine cyclo-ligase/phosphoribosylamine--glycine ligase/phosphoribosylformylglycinamidine cyclo-ligase